MQSPSDLRHDEMSVWRLQYEESAQIEVTRSSRGGTGPPWSHAMAGGSRGTKTVGQRESPDRGRDRHDQSGALWVQLSCGPFGSYDGCMWSASSPGIQHDKAGPRTRGAQRIGSEGLIRKEAQGIEGQRWVVANKIHRSDENTAAPQIVEHRADGHVNYPTSSK